MSDIVSNPLVARHISAETKLVVQEPSGPIDDSGASTKRAPLPVRVYTPAPPLRHPVPLVTEMAVDIWSGRELAWRLFMRDLKHPFRNLEEDLIEAPPSKACLALACTGCGLPASMAGLLDWLCAKTCFGSTCS